MKFNAVKTPRRIAFLALFILAGCGKQELDLNGVKIGMTQSQVAAAAPPGSSLYCLGGGDAQFDATSGLPASDQLIFCTWTTVADRRIFAPVQIGGASAIKTYLAFGTDGRLQSMSIEGYDNDYGTMEKALEDNFGSPSTFDWAGGNAGGTGWEGRDSVLEISLAGYQPRMTLVQLKPRPAK